MSTAVIVTGLTPIDIRFLKGHNCVVNRLFVVNGVATHCVTGPAGVVVPLPGARILADACAPCKTPGRPYKVPAPSPTPDADA